VLFNFGIQDNTTEVAKSFQDPRVKNVRNEQNLGLVNNFNKGIGLSRGKYVWIISADDYLLLASAIHVGTIR
jgi:glycosyltransferase involved in cell wall biosynthesis